MGKKVSDLTTCSFIKRLWPILRTYKMVWFAGLLVTVLNGTLRGLQINFVKNLIIQMSSLETKWETFWKLVRYMSFLWLIQNISSGISSYSLEWVSGKTMMALREQMLQKFLCLPVEFIENHKQGRFVSKIFYDTQQVAYCLSATLKMLVTNIFTVLTFLIVMVRISPFLSFFVMAICPFFLFFTQYAARKYREVFLSMQAETGNATHVAEEILSGHREVLLFSAQKKEAEAFHAVCERRRMCSLNEAMTKLKTTPVFDGMFMMAFCFVVLCRIFFLDGSSLSDTELFAFLGVLLSIKRPIIYLNTMCLLLIQQGVAACDSIFDFLNIPNQQHQGTHRVSRVNGRIKFESVSFSYPERKLSALKRVSLEINPHSTVAFVGRSGSGKSTIGALLSGLFFPSSGTILLDGLDLQSYEINCLRNQVGVLSQNTHIFSGTIAYNIAYGNPSATESEITLAAKQSLVSEFCVDFPKGLNTLIGQNGVSLSGGQRQRIALARVLLKNAPILFLDEATSSLDIYSAQHVQSALDALRGKKTIIMVTHQISDAIKADQVFLLENGNLEAAGSHKVLLRENKKYAKLYEDTLTEKREPPLKSFFSSNSFVFD